MYKTASNKNCIGTFYKNTSPGDVMGYLSPEYKDCGNGYCYLLINEDKFIGYDKD